MAWLIFFEDKMQNPKKKSRRTTVAGATLGLGTHKPAQRPTRRHNIFPSFVCVVCACLENMAK